MSTWGNILNWFGANGTEVHSSEYEIKSIGNLVIPEHLTDINAFTLANSVAEMYFPVDFYADRISKLRFFIANKSGKELAHTELSRFVSDSINPLFSFSDLVYAYVFSLLSDGNAINYLGVPSVYKNISPSSIARWDVLQPNKVSLYEYSNISMLNIDSLNELIKSAYYDGRSLRNELETQNLVIDNYSNIRRSTSKVLAKSPLWGANKSIDTLLSVYSARYNVYANNGAAGYLARKSTGTGQNSAFEEAISDSNKRDDIIEDINNRNGLTGKRNLWGVSGVPLEFVKTLATIKELMPFEESLDCGIKIASVLQIPPVLVPRKDQSTFDNQQGAEKNVWENGLLAMAQTVSENLTKMFRIDKSGNKILFDKSSVSALLENENDKETLIKSKLENLKTINEMAKTDVTITVNDLYKNNYGEG